MRNPLIISRQSSSPSSSSSDVNRNFQTNGNRDFGRIHSTSTTRKKPIEIPEFFVYLNENYNLNKPLSTSRMIIHEMEQIEDTDVLEATVKFITTEEVVSNSTTKKQNDDESDKRKTLISLLTPRDQTNLIRYLGSRGLFYTMQCLLKHLATNLDLYTSTNESKNHNEKKNKYNNIQYAYSAAIQALAQSTNPKYRMRTSLLLDEMDHFGIPPNSYIITAIFLSIDGGKASREMIQRARSYDGIEVDARVYNAAIYACSRTFNDTKNGWESALSLFREMKQERIKPNQQTYASLLQACAKSGQVKVAFSLFDEMKHTPNMDISNVKVWGAILRACSVAGEWEKAIQLVLEMNEKKVPINVIHMNAALASFAKMGYDNEALIILNAMQNGDSVRVLRRLLTSDNSADVDEIENRPCLPSPDLVSINTVLGTFADRNKKDEAMNLLNRVKDGEFSIRRGSTWNYVKPDIVSYNSVLATFQEPKGVLSFIHEVSGFCVMIHSI